MSGIDRDRTWLNGSMPSDATSEKMRIWHPPTLLRVSSVIAVVLAVPLAGWAIATAVDESGSVIGMTVFSVLVFLLPAAATALFAFRVRLVEGPDGVTVRTMFGERRYDWDEIVEVAPDRSGVRLTFTDGTARITGALYGPELRTFIGRPQMGNRLADAIASRSGARRAEEVTVATPAG